MTKYFLIPTMLFLFACATEEKREEPKTYSEETNRAFEMIERGGSYYLKKAPTQAPPPQIESTKKSLRKPLPPKKELQEIVVDEKINYQEEAPVERQVLPPAKKSTKVDERLVEINQHLAFYCMKQKNSAAHGGDEARCNKYVAKVQQNCQKKHPVVSNKLLNCIKSGLR